MTDASTPRTPPARLQTAVLFIVFNRPGTTAQVFEAIRKAKPIRLYVAGDGPRADRLGEADKVAKVREIATAVDWHCEVKTLFRKENLGCKYGPQTGITWFFEQEEQGIILEDDCLPHPDFFNYCEFALTEFKENKKIWHINGNNFAAPDVLFDNNIQFVSLAQVWGWASWADRWKLSELNVFYLQESSFSKYKGWKLSTKAKFKKIQHIHDLAKGLDAWDYQWQVSILNAGGLAVSPSSNLISNLGDGPDATHTKYNNARIRLPVRGLRHYVYDKIENNVVLSEWYESKMGLNGKIGPTLLLAAFHFREVCKRLVKCSLNKIVYFRQRPIVIASTGRSGSSMLTSAISQALVDNRFGWLPSVAKKYMSRFSTAYINRIYNIDISTAPIIKTHDCFRKEFADEGKFIFVFGDPLESAQSVSQMGQIHGVNWIERHIYHLGGQGNPYEIFEKDVLNYEAQIRSWGESKDVFIVHYDDLWNKVEELTEFLGFELRLPERRERTEKWLPASFNHEMFDYLRKHEQALREKFS